jgi:anti-anti-sigma factor
MAPLFSPSEGDAYPLPTFPEAPPLRCETSAERDSARIAVVGELDLATVPILESEVNAQRAAGFRRVILDLRELQFIDSSGLRCILDCHTRPSGTASRSR